MSIMSEFYASCDGCGKDHCTESYDTHAAAVRCLRADGWHVTEHADRVLCPGCRLEELHALAHSKATR